MGQRTDNRTCPTDATETLDHPINQGRDLEEEDEDQERDEGGFLQTMLRRELLLIFVITFFFSVSIGGVIGVVPDTVADRYARIHHNHTGPGCGSFEIKPLECQHGTDDAQEAAAWSNVGLSVFGLLMNPVVGSWTDLYGRRMAVIASIFVNTVSSLLFLQTIVLPRMDPAWYYVSCSLVGGFQYLGLVFAALSDVVSESYRAGSFGLLLGMFYGGFALAPLMPLFLDHTMTAMVCALLSTAVLVAAAFLFPETLPTNVQESNRLRGEEQSRHSVLAILEPIKEFSILNRDWTMRLVAVGQLISSMVYASDHTLFLFYAEDRFGFGDDDVAKVFLALGIFGLLLQTVALQPMVQCAGETILLVLTFACGALHNLLYGVATSKNTLFAAVILSQFTKVNMPVLASYASENVPKTEQGRIQGALSACIAIGAAAGPLSMEFVYHHTKNRTGYGPGFMFVYAGCLYFVGACAMALLPHRPKPGTTGNLEEGGELQSPAISNDLEEPLLDQPLEGE